MDSTAKFPSLTEKDVMFFCDYTDGEYEALKNCATPESLETIALSS